MAGIRLVIVGGGSIYTLVMLRSLAILAKGPLKGSSFVLMDRNADNVKLMGEFGRNFAKSQGGNFTVEYTTDLKKSLGGADFVLSSFRSGGLAARKADESIPPKYNLVGQETTGPGGVFMVLREIPNTLELAHAMEKACPDAWLVNYSNPTNANCDAVRQRTSLKCAGLCDGVYGGKHLAAKLLKLPPEEQDKVDIYVAGVNHSTWTLRAEYKGRDVYPELRKAVAEADPEDFSIYRIVSVRLFKHYGIMPGTAAYTRYYYNVRATMAQQASEEHYKAEVMLENGARQRKVIQKQVDEGRGEFTEDMGETSHGDQALGFINAIANDTCELQTVNVPNNGCVANLPLGSIVEVACRVGQNGPVPFAMGELPKPVYAQVRGSLDSMELAVEAALTGDRNKVFEAVMTHPLVDTLDDAERAIADLFEAHAPHLPQFK